MVATIEIRRPPHNFFDIELIRQIADACEALDKDDSLPRHRAGGAGHGVLRRRQARRAAPTCRTSWSRNRRAGQAGHLYIEAVRLFRTAKPIVGAIHGAAVGGGLGLALVPDLRVTCPEARFCGQLHAAGLPPGLRPHPHAAGADRPVPGGADVLHQPPRDRARRPTASGLADVLVPQAEVRSAAQKLAAEIALAAPLGVLETRATMRAGLADRVRAATDIELEKQTRLRKTADFKEGVDATNQRRLPKFVGR